MSSKGEFGLSISAQNIEAKFYNKDGIVYVEGDDDILFWAQFFNSQQFEIRKVNGCKNLEDYENDILNDGLKCIVAKDADYTAYNNCSKDHPLIVCTLSHSIECVMYCPYNVNACLKKLARTLDNHLDEINQYYEEFHREARELLVYDIANDLFAVGRSICGDSCIPFMESNHSLKVSSEKRDSFLKTVNQYFTPQQIKNARKYLDNDNRDLRQIIKGHFQTSFIVNLLKQLTSRIKGNGSPSISKDTLYALLITCYPECHVDCNEKKVIIKRVNDAIEALK